MGTNEKNLKLPMLSGLIYYPEYRQLFHRISLGCEHIYSWWYWSAHVLTGRIPSLHLHSVISSQLSVESGQVTINSNRLVVDSTNFKLDSAGNATFSGKVKGAIIEGDGVTCIGETNSTTIKNGSLTTSYINVSQQNSADNVGITPGNVLVKNASGQTNISPTLITANQINCGNINGGTPITTANKDSQINILYASTVPQVVSAGANFRPHSSSGDNNISCGSPSYRWTQVYAATATISTSDRALKEQEALITEKEKRVALKIKQLLKTFKYRDAVSEKGDNARIHTGVIAQDVKEAFESEGLNPYDYALFCSDTWYEKEGCACDDNEISYTASDEGVTEFTRLGIRYEELLCFVMAAL